MLDYRIYTFLKLCDLMNYRATSEALNITQPAVTQHIQYLENYYQCKLFDYNRRKITKTKAAIQLEKYARMANYNQRQIKETLKEKEKKIVNIGATKTIGDYVIGDEICHIATNNEVQLSLIVDNTTNLLNMLRQGLIDLALIEGFFDKQEFNSQLYKKEKFLGICASDHPFKGKSIPINLLFKERLILRERGSGTREVFEQTLTQQNYSLDNFNELTTISGFELIKDLVRKHVGISFVYETIAQNDSTLGTFTIEGLTIERAFNFVMLNEPSQNNTLTLFN